MIASYLSLEMETAHRLAFRSRSVQIIETFLTEWSGLTPYSLKPRSIKGPYEAG